MQKHTVLLASLVLLILASGCKKDEEAEANPVSPIPPHTCFITKETESTFVTEVLYDAANRIVRVNSYQPSGTLGYYSVYTYSSGGQVIKLEDFDENGQLSQYFTYNYDARQRLVKTSSYFRSSAADPFELSGYQTYEYNGGNQLVKTNWFEDASTVSQFYELLQYTGPNATQLQGFAAGSSTAEYTYTYTYDTGLNPYRGILHFDLELPAFVSKNTPLSVTRTDASGTVSVYESHTYNYEYNANGYPEAVEFTDLSGYTSGAETEYNCP